MTAFGKTILGKALGTGAKIAIDSNPITRSAKNLLNGVTSAKKDEAKKKVEVQKSAPQKASATGGNMDGFFKKNKTVLGITFPIWIWLVILVVIFVVLWFGYKWLFKKRRSGTTRRRSGSSSSMRTRMARVRSFRKKRK